MFARSCIFALIVSITLATQVKADFEIIEYLDSDLTINKPQDVQVGYKYKALLNNEPYQKTLTSISSKGLTWISSNNCITTNLVQFAIPCSWTDCEPFEDGTSKTTFFNSIWPLHVGKHFKIGNDLGTINLIRGCVVESVLKIKTSLGVFDTLKIVCSDLSNELTWYMEAESGRTIYHVHKNIYHGFTDVYETTE